MTKDRRTVHVLAALLPAGALGFSLSLAAADVAAATSSADNALQEKTESMSLRLEAIRSQVSVVVSLTAEEGQDYQSAANATKLAWWGKGGWGNGGWHNGGWRNGGWGNGFHNW
jgi:rSAM-associated Gly-rich repeat protein